MKMFAGVDPGSEEGDYTTVFKVENGKINVIDKSAYNEIRMLRLFKLLCSGKDFITERILVKHLAITKEEATETITSLVKKGKLKRVFEYNIHRMYRGDKLFD